MKATIEITMSQQGIFSVSVPSESFKRSIKDTYVKGNYTYGKVKIQGVELVVCFDGLDWEVDTIETRNLNN